MNSLPFLENVHSDTFQEIQKICSKEITSIYLSRLLKHGKCKAVIFFFRDFFTIWEKSTAVCTFVGMHLVTLPEESF